MIRHRDSIVMCSLVAVLTMAASLGSSSPAAVAQAVHSPGRDRSGQAEIPPGFRILTEPSVASQLKARATSPHMLPPSPLTMGQVASRLESLGIHVGKVTPLSPIPQNANEGPPAGFSPSIVSYQGYFQNVNLLVADLTSLQAGTIPGMVVVQFSVAPQMQLVLDCRVTPDGTFEVQTLFDKSNGLFADVLGANLTSANGHLLIPFGPAPPLAINGEAYLQLKNVTFYGCQLDGISQ